MHSLHTIRNIYLYLVIFTNLEQTENKWLHIHTCNMMIMCNKTSNVYSFAKPSFYIARSVLKDNIITCFENSHIFGSLWRQEYEIWIQRRQPKANMLLNSLKIKVVPYCQISKKNVWKRWKIAHIFVIQYWVNQYCVWAWFITYIAQMLCRNVLFW